MKAIKTTLAQSGTTMYIKALLFGTIAGAAVTAVLMSAAALLLIIAGTLPQKYLVWAAIATCAAGTFISGYVTSRITKINGLMLGALSGVIMFLILFFSGLAKSEETLTYITLVKLLAFVICGAIGGIKGVNKKDKIRIR